MQHLYETDSDRSSIELTSKSKVTELRNMYSGKSKDNVTDDYASSHITDSHSCNICNDQSGPFIILSCNHIFHINKIGIFIIKYRSSFLFRLNWKPLSCAYLF